MPSVEYEDELFTGAYPQERSDSPTLGTWDDDTDERDLKPKRRPVVADYIYPRPSSSFAPGRTAMHTRPRAATQPKHPVSHGEWSPEYEPPSAGVSPSSAYLVDSPLPNSHPPVPANSLTSVAHSASDEDYATSDLAYSHSTSRSPNMRALPDPARFPDPYPYRPPRWHLGSTTPALSSTDSSSASTRSSAYTSSAKSGDYGHVHVALGDDEPEPGVGVGITTDDVVQLLAQDAGTSSSSATHGRTPVDQTRWSDFYSNGMRSRSSSVGNSRNDSAHDNGIRVLRGTPSFDMGWQAVDERDEAMLGSEEETDDEPSMDEDEDEEVEEEQPASAVVVAEEGRGVIVRGDDVPIVRVHVVQGTTHLLIGSSSTPNAVPAFLTNTLPQISDTLLALDISANFLSALPPALAACENLEELNIASNPLRALPLFLSSLTSLRVLIVDSTGINALPPSLSSLDKLHTMSIRRNKMSSLPSWLCLLPSLETLLVDGNPFQGPWKALMEPLLSKSPLSPVYPPSTPMFPLHSASVQSITSDNTDGDEFFDSPATMDRDSRFDFTQEDEDTITPARAPYLARSITEPAVSQAMEVPSPGLSRTRTTPNRTYYDKNRPSSKSPQTPADDGPAFPQPSSSRGGQDGIDREVRRMKSAGELRRNRTTNPPQLPSKSLASSPQRAALSEYHPSASSSNLLNMGSNSVDQSAPKRFASLGVAAGGMMSNSGKAGRTMGTSLWDNPTEEDAHDVPPLPAKASPPHEKHFGSDHGRHRGKDDKDKSSRWGFLKKMSMGKMRPDPPPQSKQPITHSRPQQMAPYPRGGTPKTLPAVPSIDVRISTTGSLLQYQGHSPPREMVPPSLSRKSSNLNISTVNEAPKMLSVSSPNLLAPAPTSRANKRRSFLPIDMSPIPIPSAAPFLPGVTATNSIDEGDDVMVMTPSPVLHVETCEQIQRREEERAREARVRALRSVMAYLKDMYDLGLSQTQTMSMYGNLPGTTPETSGSGTRSRRPTVVDGGRLGSESSVASIASMSSLRPESSVHLRSPEVRVGLRSGSATQTNSVATTDSGGSGGGEERKYKDDKGKRARVIREIVETERTYVKGLQELVDIYIKPASATVNVLSGVGQIKDTVVPAQERKIVFSGLEALFSFHKESFLPALERASAPLLSPKEGSKGDVDGHLSSDVARDVANTFVSHAAFMKMYSTYINNFDNSVQRIRTWVSDRSGPSSGGQTLSPSSSSAQLVGLGLTMAAGIASTTSPDGPSAHNVAPLSSSQKKRIRAYIKRCRMNPRHSQLNLEGYLLLPVQRIPRYRLLLEELVRSSPPMYEYMEDPIDRALTEIAELATNMNEGKRESESRRRLVLWQSRIRGKFPSPLVQPHRRLIMDGPLQLTRVVRKATVSFEVIDSSGDASSVQVECLSPELTPRSLIGILCNDLLVLCRDPSEGKDPNSFVDLWAVLRMQTLPQPASIVHGNALRLVDNKAILYFDAPSTSDALTWFRAINLHIPASKA